MKRWNAMLQQFATYVGGNLIEEIKNLLKLKVIAITQENKEVLLFSV